MERLIDILEREAQDLAIEASKEIKNRIDLAESKPKYIADAIYWSRLTKCWLRVRDLNLITFRGETSYTPAVPAGNGILLIRKAYPYEPWMEEFIGTNSKEIINRTKHGNSNN